MVVQVVRVMILTCTTKTCKRSSNLRRRSHLANLPASRARSQSGFTLVELLIVVVILATTAALVSTNFSGREDAQKIEFEAARLIRLIELGREAALLSGREWGLIIGPNHYRFIVYTPRFESYELATEAHFRQRNLKGISLHLVAEGGGARDADEEDSEQTSARGRDVPQEKTQILLLSNGECTPFRLGVADTYGHEVWIGSDGLNEAVVIDHLNEDADNQAFAL